MWRVSIGMLAVLWAALAAAEAEVNVKNDDTHVTIASGDRELIRYKFAGVPFKPYVQELRTPGGINVLLDAPHDHLHHHGLMFALAVDGVDFWSELDACGRQIHRAFEAGAAGGLVENLDWVTPEGKELLHEQRQVTAGIDSDTGATMLTWRARLDVPPDKGQVALSGDHYFGLGLRFVEAMNGNGKFLTSTGEAGEVVRGEERNVPADWCAYASAIDGKDVTVAMFSARANPRHPAVWFTMPVPFAYLSATLNLHKEPMTLEAGAPLEVCYGVALWDGRQNQEAIQGAYGRWLESLPRN